MQPPTEQTLALEVAVLCSCSAVYDKRVGRCPRCADVAGHALDLAVVLGRDGGVIPNPELEKLKEEN
jgi:hypothetical protein